MASQPNYPTYPSQPGQPSYGWSVPVDQGAWPSSVSSFPRTRISYLPVRKYNCSLRRFQVLLLRTTQINHHHLLNHNHNLQQQTCMAEITMKLVGSAKIPPFLSLKKPSVWLLSGISNACISIISTYLQSFQNKLKQESLRHPYGTVGRYSGIHRVICLQQRCEVVLPDASGNVVDRICHDFCPTDRAGLL